MIHVFGVSSCRRVLTQHREICSDLAIEQRHLLQLRARKLRQAITIGKRKQLGKAVPVGPSLGDPLV